MTKTAEKPYPLLGSTPPPGGVTRVRRGNKSYKGEQGITRGKKSKRGYQRVKRAQGVTRVRKRKKR